MTLELCLSFFLGILSGFLAILVGGGGLVSVPGLMLLGIPPHIAIATNKAAAGVIMLVGGVRFSMLHDVPWKEAGITTLIATVMSYYGSEFLLDVPVDTLERLIGVVLLALLALLLYLPAQGLERVPSVPWWKKLLGYSLFLPIGFWGGFFGGGYAILAANVYVFLFGFTFLDACALKLVNGLGIAVVSVWVFVLAGIIDWPVAIALGCGNAIGSYIAPKYAVKRGNRFIRTLFIVMVAACAIKFLIF